MVATLGTVVPLQAGIIDQLPLLLLLAGTALIVAEALAPGAHFVVLGMALFLAGIIGVIFPPLGSPLALAGMVILFAALTFYVYSQFDIYGGKGSGQTTDSDSLKGGFGRVTETVTATEGEVKLEDGGFNPYYTARSVDGETIEEGEEIVVVDPGGGNVLKVQSVGGDRVDEIDRELQRGRRADGSASDTESDGGEVERERESERE